MIEQAEGVERVADDLCDGPGCDKQQHAVLTLHLREHTHGEDGRRKEEQRGSHHAAEVTPLEAKPDFSTQNHAVCFRCCLFQTLRDQITPQADGHYPQILG